MADLFGSWVDQIGTWVNLLLLGAISMAIGWIAAQQWYSLEMRRMRVVRENERQEADKAVAGLRRELMDLTGRGQEQLEAFQALPEVVREVFAAGSRRAIVPVMVRLVDLLLHPEHATVWVARPGQRKLALAQGIGLSAALPVGTEIDYGQGRAGYVAEARMPLEEGDFRTARGEDTTKALEVKQRVTASEIPGMRADAVAPVLDGNQVFAVVSVAGARSRRGLEKRLLTLVTSVASIALQHVEQARVIEEATGFDGMTGLHNKIYLSERLAVEINKADREGIPVSVVLFDIDDLRVYNQGNGHVQGDELIKQIAAVMRKSIRSDDVAARFGGEEFVVVYPGADKATALQLADKLREAVAEYPFPFRGLQPQGKVTLSGGVATCPDDSKVARDLIRCADQAMLDAKQSGRNRVVAGTPNFLT